MTDELNIEAVRLSLSVDNDSDQTPGLEGNLETAKAFVAKQSPDAPQAVKNEAMLRFIGYLFEIGPTAHIDQSGIWTRCGAKGLLSPWTERHAGVIE